MTVVFVVCSVLLAIGGTFAIIRAERGPSMLDRAVALDLFSATIVGAFALEAAWSRRVTTIPILVVISLVGFVSSVTIARFASVDPESKERVPASDDPSGEDDFGAAPEDVIELEGTASEFETGQSGDDPVEPERIAHTATGSGSAELDVEASHGERVSEEEA